MHISHTFTINPGRYSVLVSFLHTKHRIFRPKPTLHMYVSLDNGVDKVFVTGYPIYHLYPGVDVSRSVESNI